MRPRGRPPLACGGGRIDPDDDAGPQELVEITFTASPLRLEDITSVTPLGSVNPPEHTITNDHIALLPPAGHVLLVQLVTDTRLMVEVFADGTLPTGSTSNAVVYER